jgi:DNA-binding HxlR family transcriptional regulator
MTDDVMSEPSPALEAAQTHCADVLSADCPSRVVLRHVTSQWGVLLLLVLMERMHRFSELRRKVGGVSEKMLAQTLKWLEADGFVDRVSLPVVPPHVEYSLTPLGHKVAKRVGALANWIEESIPEIMEAQQARASSKA